MTVIALDIGGTKIVGAELNTDLTIVKSLRVPTQAKKGKKYVLNTIKLVIESLLNNRKKQVKAIGISLPGFVNNGKIVFAGTVLSFLVGTNLEQILEKKFGLPVYIENDANCFTLAESTIGAGSNHDVVLGVVWGSGIGAGLVIKHEDGETLLFEGRQGGALELGHVQVYHNGKYQPLEKIVGGRFLTKKFKVESVKDLYNSKVKEQKDAFNDTLKHLGQTLAIAVNILNPGVIVLGGGVSNLPKNVYLKLGKIIQKNALATHVDKLEIRQFEIADDAGLFGAGLIALDHKKEISKKKK